MSCKSFLGSFTTILIPSYRILWGRSSSSLSFLPHCMYYTVNIVAPEIYDSSAIHSSPQTRQNDSCGPGAQQYCSNEDGHASPVMKRRSLALQGHNCHFSSLRRAMAELDLAILSQCNHSIIR